MSASDCMTASKAHADGADAWVTHNPLLAAQLRDMVSDDVKDKDKRVQGCKDATAAGNPCREEVGEALHHTPTVPCNCRHGLRGSGK